MAQEYFISKDPDPDHPAIFDSALQRTRYRELSPFGECDNLSFVDRLERDHIEDGRWATSSTSNLERLQVFSPTYCSHDEDHAGDELPWDCSPCTTQVCKTMPGCCGAGPTPGWTVACTTQAAAVCQTGGVRWPLGKVWPKDLPTDDQSVYPTYLFGPAGAVLRADGTSGPASSATISGWACDPEWAGATVKMEIYGGGPRELGGTLLGDGSGRSGARHAARARGERGVRRAGAFLRPARVLVHAAGGPVGQRVRVRHRRQHRERPGRAADVDSQRHRARAPLRAQRIRHGRRAVRELQHLRSQRLRSECSVLRRPAGREECAAAADSCAAGTTSAAVNSRSFASIMTGWIEAPTSGVYTFEASRQPSRLFINGANVLDWFQTTPGTTSGTITLSAGKKYHLRWDRFQAAPPAGTPGPGLTWQPPLTVGQAPIPSGNLYAIAPGVGSGLTAPLLRRPRVRWRYASREPTPPSTSTATSRPPA